MNLALTRAAFAAMALALSMGVSAADRKDDSAKVARGDRNFIEKTMVDGATEVELGKLAQQNGSSQAVKDFGKRMVDDHSKSGEELQAIATKLGVTPKKTGPDNSAVKKFSKLQGDKFDREYAQMMVKDHEKTVKNFEKHANAKGGSEELKQFASKTLPTLQEHLKMARDMAPQKSSGRKSKDS